MSLKAKQLPLIAVAQLTSSNDIEANFKACEDLTERAAARQASMVFFPENFAFLGAASGASPKMAEEVTGPLVGRYCALARRFGVWLSLGGFQERGDVATHVYNAHLIVNSTGQIVAHYRKIHLFDVDTTGGTFRESGHVKAGDKVVVVDSPIGKLGLAVCYDLRFPELFQSLTKLGAEILLVPSAFTLRTGLAHWHVLLRARAIENGCYVVAAAQTGVHNPASAIVLDDVKDGDKGKDTPRPGPLRESFGHAVVCDPWGHVVAEASEGAGLIFAEIDLTKVKTVRAAIPVARHKRPELYEGFANRASTQAKAKL